MKKQRRFIVLGGAGTIGKFVARDLFESHPDNQIVIADYKKEAAQSLTRSFKDPRVRAKFADARDLEKLTSLLKNQSVVINCLQHNFNLMVMEAALLAGVHYVDLGGLFTWTRKQLRLNKKFRDAGLTAIIGGGCAPGITNVLAAYAASKLDKINEISIRVGSKNFNPPNTAELWFPYSAQTIIEELTLRPWIWTAGKFRQIAPRTGWQLTQFPKPVGKIWTVYTRHSEIATLPLNFKDKGLRHCTFGVSFSPLFVEKILKCLEAGWTLQQFNKFGTPAENPNDYEVSRVKVDDLIIDCHAQAKPEWQASAGDIDTACPISIIAQMIANGVINRLGVSPPELAVPAEPFFSELEKRGMKIKINHQA